MLFHEGTTYTAHTHLPQWFTDMANILEFEMRAAIFGVVFTNAIVGPGPILLCCDNQGADGIIIRGSRQSDLARALSSVFWQTVAANNIPTWLEYVKSDLNVADPPSRACCVPPKPSATKATNHGTPAQFHTMMTSVDALNKAKLNPPAMETDFPPPRECKNVETPPVIQKETRIWIRTYRVCKIITTWCI